MEISHGVAESTEFSTWIEAACELGTSEHELFDLLSGDDTTMQSFRAAITALDEDLTAIEQMHPQSEFRRYHEEVVRSARAIRDASTELADAMEAAPSFDDPKYEDDVTRIMLDLVELARVEVPPTREVVDALGTAGCGIDR